VCAPDPNAGARARAKMEHAGKQLAFEGKRVQYYNKEVAASKRTDANIIGLSRDYSDAARKARWIADTARKQQEGITVKAAQKLGTHLDLKSGEAGSRDAGKSAYLEVLRAQAELENKVDHVFTEQMASTQNLIGRGYQVRRAKNRAALGLPPNPGEVLTFMPPKDKWGQRIASLKLGLEIASTAMGIGTGMQSFQKGGGFGGMLKAPTSNTNLANSLSSTSPIWEQGNLLSRNFSRNSLIGSKLT